MSPIERQKGNRVTTDSDPRMKENRAMENAKTKELLPIYADGEIGARILAAMEAYRREYVYSPEYGSDHEPTDFEQVLLEDFLNGAFTGEVSAILQEAARFATPAPSTSTEGLAKHMPSRERMMEKIASDPDNVSCEAGIFACLDPSSTEEALRAENERLREALEFYADPENWIDTPAWDGDPEVFTPKAIPVRREDGTFHCDCGDTALSALSR